MRPYDLTDIFSAHRRHRREIHQNQARIRQVHHRVRGNIAESWHQNGSAVHAWSWRVHLVIRNTSPAPLRPAAAAN